MELSARTVSALGIGMTLLACGRVGFGHGTGATDGGNDGGLEDAAPMDASVDSGEDDAGAEEPDASRPPPGPVSSLHYSWHQELHTASGGSIWAVTANPTAGFVLGGLLHGDLEIAGMAWSVGSAQPFLAYLDPETGEPRRFEPLDPRTQPPSSLSSDGLDNLYVSFHGGLSLTWAMSSRPDGSSRWLREDASVLAWSIRGTSDGHCFVGGSYNYARTSGTDFIGDGVFTVNPAAFVTRLNELGERVWVRRLEGPESEDIRALAHGGGQVVAVALVDSGGTIDLGGGAMPVPVDSEYVMAAYSADDGTLLWFDFLEGDVVVGDLAMDGTGGIYMTGSVTGDADVAGEVLSTPGDLAFLIAYDAAGTPLWSRTYGDPAYTNLGRALTIDEDGNIYVAGDFSIAADFGDGLVVTDHFGDGFVAAYDGTGAHQWSFTFGGEGVDDVTGLTIGERGRLLMAATVSGVVNFEGATIGRASIGTTFVASFER